MARLQSAVVVPRRGRWFAWIGGGAAVVLAAIASLVWWLNKPDETPRALQFRDFDVCLLVGTAGITGDPAATTWAGLQRVAGDAKVRLSYLKVSGPQTEAQAKLFVPTLVQQSCDVIVAVGKNQTDAARALTANYPDIRFLLVDSAADANGVVAQVTALLPET
jgi:basic membrane lipoprotein Med (substrate-binding protein (PBP1-ABC) superfamily)